jgi:hypothetical protein
MKVLILSFTAVPRAIGTQLVDREHQVNWFEGGRRIRANS